MTAHDTDAQEVQSRIDRLRQLMRRLEALGHDISGPESLLAQVEAEFSRRQRRKAVLVNPTSPARSAEQR